MCPPPSPQTVAQAGQIAPIVIKKSKFIASISPVKTEFEARQFLKKIRGQHPKANHHCSAYRIYRDTGVIPYEDDDGEPSGTAGQPMLYVMEKQSIVNASIVVTRYFGGVKLGKGRLARAYSKAASAILSAAELLKFTETP